MLPVLPWLLLLGAAESKASTLNPCLQPDLSTYFSVRPHCESRGEWNGHPYRIRTNALGLRDQEIGPKGARQRVVLLGSSELFGPGLENDELPARHFAAELASKSKAKFEVINAGVEGFSTVQQLIVFDDRVLRDLQPDYIVYTLSSSTVFGNATQSLFANDDGKNIHLLFFPRFFWPYLATWPRLTSFAFFAMREASEIGSALRIRARQLFGHDDTFALTAGYLARMRERCEAHGIKFLVVRYGASQDYRLNVHYRKYSYPGAVQAFFDAITPNVLIDAKDFEPAMKTAGLTAASLSEDERNRIFQGSLSNDLHVNRDGAKVLGTLLADRFLDWQRETAKDGKK